MGTRSGKKSSGSLVGGNTGGTFAGKFSAATVTIKLDLPLPRSPATTIRTPVLPYGFVFPAEAFAIEKSSKNAKLQTPHPTKKTKANHRSSRKSNGINTNILITKPSRTRTG